ncbi:MAG: diacylglycerol kinase family protein [Flavobacteriaceae bacterium]|nr:diacylglycerol kinase family protein [Mangrovimonas sp.]MCB0470507.1 diacylglycerol kinase family protein [Flavobacteriaceae bacterium]MCB0433398.1 diacylglycerol kinase family protein [Mangrovimonas sp.]MCB0436115.1 diacylglycerol kinase family protein [Mangrovimonas sp.]MCB0437241.1 diacylglycerol kinase family protein [Mangrovimonas sp.]
MSEKESFLMNRIRSVGYAFKGAFLLLKTEASIQIQFVIAILVTIAGFYFKISATEWIMQIFAIGLVMGIEGLNTAVESIADFIHPEHHKKIGFIKDISAGAVFIAAIVAIIIGFIIYFPKLF